MKKSKKGSEHTATQLELFAAVGSLDFANPIQQQENGSARRIPGTSGRRCLESFKSAAPTRLWARTFLESLVGTGDWYSTRCKLTWKLKGTTYKRLYFQLAVSALPTGGTGYGLLATPDASLGTGGKVTSQERVSNTGIVYATGEKRQISLKDQLMRGLLPTPLTNDSRGKENSPSEGLRSSLSGAAYNGLLPTPDTNNHRDGSKLRKDNNLEDGGRHGVSLHHLAAHALLPTPQSRDQKNGSKPEDSRTLRKQEQGWSMNLNDLAAGNLLPTPRASEHKESGPKGSHSSAYRLEKGYLDATMIEAAGTTGTTSQLSGRFVLEMMGFPPDWVESAFLALAKESQQAASTSSPSRRGATRSCPRSSYKSSVLCRIVGKTPERGE